MPGAAAISMATAAVNAFSVAAALELKDEKRLNAVSPAFVKETMEMLGMDSTYGIPAEDVATYYQASVEGKANGEVFDAINGKYVNQA
ncbi:hypothetical protein [uncultured Shewanella sp.]|uniref:hypothetical protein n=1 Tax=Shewanella atlantica TaxID=271099 RepID=UPI002609C9C1|nr:hypothetical protein [uncultured Shewanella sp.]